MFLFRQPHLLGWGLYWLVNSLIIHRVDAAATASTLFFMKLPASGSAVRGRQSKCIRCRPTTGPHPPFDKESFWPMGEGTWVPCPCNEVVRPCHGSSPAHTRKNHRCPASRLMLRCFGHAHTYCSFLSNVVTITVTIKRISSLFSVCNPKP